MARPSLASTAFGIDLAKVTLRQRNLTQLAVAEAIGCSRQPVSHFFRGKAIDQKIFLDICQHLGLDEKLVAGWGLQSPEPQIDVQGLRERIRDNVQRRCGSMRVLDMERPIEISAIYTDVKVLEKISGRQRLSVEELTHLALGKNFDLGTQTVDGEMFDRFSLGRVEIERIGGAETLAKYRRLVLLGKPGAGKTTFLKHLAMRCISGKFVADCLPLFISLKHWIEDPQQLGLLDYVARNEFLDAAAMEGVVQLLQEGKVLLLLDGLDEVSAAHQQRASASIRDFCDRYSQNYLLMTCRIAAWEYTFEHFTEVELADFDDEQIANFTRKWFLHKPIPHERLLAEIKRLPRLRQLAVTPILLTMICLTFEEAGECPYTRADLYREAVGILLKKWDAQRGIYRDRPYQKLSLLRKERLLSRIALRTFQNGQYFFAQDLVQAEIHDYFRMLPDGDGDVDGELDAEAVLHSMEAQHGLLIERAKGIYSFSHLTIHEYFAARQLLLDHSQSIDYHRGHTLLPHAADPAWREVWLLVVDMLSDADILLGALAAKIVDLRDRTPELQKLLVAADFHGAELEVYGIDRLAARALLFDVDFEIDQNRTIALRLHRKSHWFIVASFLMRILGVSLKEAMGILGKSTKLSDLQKTVTAEDSMAIAIEVAPALQAALASSHLSVEEQQKFQNWQSTTLQSSLLPSQTAKQTADEARGWAKRKRRLARRHDDDNLDWSDLAIDDLPPAVKEIIRQYYYCTSILAESLKSPGCTMLVDRRRALEQSLFQPAP
jgi:transcriptional regulator with XRE-family HTH domain/energy-coupling factor transporter ATP-binding protein EcfA2